MGDGSNSINYHRVGVIRENPMRCIYTADDQGEIFIVSSSEFENRTDLKDGWTLRKVFIWKDVSSCKPNM